MNHTTLLIFKLVAETQSVTQAAKQLGRAQSNITTRIQQLEEELEVELFVRGNKKMLLSPAGQNFLSYARRILSLAEEAKLALHPARPAGTLKLGAMEACAASRLPRGSGCFPSCFYLRWSAPLSAACENIRQSASAPAGWRSPAAT